MFNLGDEDVSIARGDRIAQLILERIYTPEVVEVDDLDETDRYVSAHCQTVAQQSQWSWWFRLDRCVSFEEAKTQ